MAGQILSLHRLLTPAALTHLVTTAATQLSDHRQGHTETVSVTQMVNTRGERGEREEREEGGGREEGERREWGWCCDTAGQHMGLQSVNYCSVSLR